MTTKYSPRAVESIPEGSEDESNEEIKGSDHSSSDEGEHRQSQPAHNASMRAHSARERERSKRAHKATAIGSRHIAKPRTRTTGVQRPEGVAPKDNASDGSRHRHRRTHSNKSGSSASGSSSEEGEPTQDHRAVLAAAKARLSSPSTISAFTTLTTSTSKSSGSSGSNSTVTQASITKRSAGKKPEGPEAPSSPAVPDPPNVFAFLDKDDSPESEDEDEQDHSEGHEEHEENEDEEASEEEDDDPGEGPSNWATPQPESAYVPTLVTAGSPQNSSVSSAASSFQGDDTFSQPADHDTDRSTSPERSVKGQHEAGEAPAPSATDPVAAKIASQMAAAQHRQSMYGSMQQFGTPNMPRGNYQLPVVPPSALSARYQQQVKPHALPRAEKIPVTGYELLASRLSYSREAEERGERIRPMYRKFEALNHRLLLHLQDEISELEEQLHRLDNADTQSRRTDRFIVPASRRAAAQAGGELQWHKTDVLGKIGYKLAQYSTSHPRFPKHKTDKI
jgi:hypothetical protein